ncbi:Tuberculostearic acid methyltransferase UfaA1 [Mycena venus]|uniref:Tuberculostearic acid methyltransferase UfaA1 n=1 Tax=Mycena venus TaxID=2733690 RepID=A0A8H6YDS3_9AGAR|nr:Tuberculostearic acid methyltransferase UfaA1 [Mycena venus]
MATVTSGYVKTVNYAASNEKQGLRGYLNYFTNGVQDVLLSSPLNPFHSFAKSTVLSILKNIKQGRLFIESLGETHEFGEPFTLRTAGPPTDLKATIKVLDENFWTRVFLHTDFGFADSYMLNEIEVDGFDLNNAFRIFILNRKRLSEMHTWATPLIRTASYIANTRLANGLSGSKSNISAHYDLPNELFTGFLSWDLTYSGAIFDDEAKGAWGDFLEDRPIAPPRLSYLQDRTIPADDLERGQLEKLHRMCKRARLRPGSRVLEIGCGWGSFAIMAAGTYGATVDTITISVEQKIAVDKTIAEAGLTHMITVHVLDYRSIPDSFHHAFDACVSIGVMEHIGIEFMGGWFKKMAWAMKEENSFKVFTMTTCPGLPMGAIFWVDFIRKYIYPGGQLSSLRTLIDHIADAGLNLETVENIGPHYPRTLREWSRRFQQNFDGHIKVGLQKRHPDLSEQEIEIFRRKWVYYFAYSEAGFALNNLSDSMVTVTREANLNLGREVQGSVYEY